jgi:menaquinone-dependent protoporphyrinogen IX oxidase
MKKKEGPTEQRRPSKYGPTRGIAEFIADKLRSRGMGADAREMFAVRRSTD